MLFNIIDKNWIEKIYFKVFTNHIKNNSIFWISYDECPWQVFNLKLHQSDIAKNSLCNKLYNNYADLTLINVLMSH